MNALARVLGFGPRSAPRTRRHGALRADAGDAWPARRLCIVIHDVAPANAAQCRAIREALAALGPFPVTLLAVPRMHGAARDAAFEHWLRSRDAHGDEVALHGFFHRDDGTARTRGDAWLRGVYTRHEGEFWDLSHRVASERIAAGLGWLAELGIVPSGFVAPAWLVGPGTWEALASFPLDYTCTLRRLWLLPEETSWRCMGVACSHSSAWRRVLSRVWAPLLAAAQRRAPLCRLELHPGDWDHPALQRLWLRLCRRALAARRPCTMADIARSLRDEDPPPGGPASPFDIDTARAAA